MCTSKRFLSALFVFLCLGSISDAFCDSPRKTNSLVTIYPPESVRRGEEGEVLVHFLLSTEGYPENIKLEKSSGYSRLDEAALAAVRQLKGLPSGAQKGGTGYSLPVRFKLVEAQQEDARQVAKETSGGNRLEAVKRMLGAMRLGEVIVRVAKAKLAETISSVPGSADDVAWIVERLTPDEAIERLAPVYADYLTTAQADELRAFLTSPLGNRVWQGILEEIITGKPAFSKNLSWDEKLALDNLEKNTAWRALSNSQQAINSRLEAVRLRWGEELMQQRYADFARSLADTLDGATPGSANARSPVLEPGENSSNRGLIPSYFALTQAFAKNYSEVINRSTAKVKEINLSTVLQGANLTSRDGIKDGRRKLDLYEAEFSKHQRELNRLYDDYTASLRALPGPEKTRDLIVQKAQKGVAVSYERSMRYEENQRRALGIMRRTLDLAEQGFGQIRVQDNRLIFDNVTDLRLYESLQQQLAAEIKIETDIQQEQRTAREDAVKALRENASQPNPPSPPAARSQPLQPKVLAKGTGDFWFATPQEGRSPPPSPCRSDPLPKKLAYGEALKMAVERCFIAPPFLAESAKCELEIHQAANGKVESAKVGECVGHPLLGDFVTRAAYKASPLPLPENPKAFLPVVRLLFNLSTRSSAASKNGHPPAETVEIELTPIPPTGPIRRGESQATQANNLDATSQAMARLEAEISENVDAYIKRPRKKFLGSRTEEYRFAKYLEDWCQKTEKVGTANYPEAARGKLYGSLVITTTIKSDGSLAAPPEINRTSGHKILDDAAIKIVEMAAPYTPFSPDIRRDTDMIVITRTWNFTRGGAVADAEAAKPPDSAQAPFAGKTQSPENASGLGAAAPASSKEQWIQKIREKIRSNTTFPANVQPNLNAEFSVIQLPSGEVLSVKLLSSSGLVSYDNAIERAIIKSSPLPVAPSPSDFVRDLRIRYSSSDGDAKSIRPYMGIRMLEVTKELADAIGLKDRRGVLINETELDSPASKAGLERGDILLKIGGLPVGTPDEYMSVLATTTPGEAVPMEVWRKGVSRSVQVTIGNSLAKMDTPPLFEAIRSNSRPAYPRESLKAMEQGKTMLKVFVDAQGHPLTVALEESSGFQRLDQAAIEAVKTWQFIPAKKGDIPTSAWVRVPIVFKLD